jgi:hypothetical protein
MPNELFTCHIHNPADGVQWKENTQIPVEGNVSPVDFNYPATCEVFFENPNTGAKIGGLSATIQPSTTTGHWATTVTVPLNWTNVYIWLCVVIYLNNTGGNTPMPYRKHAIRLKPVPQN